MYRCGEALTGAMGMGGAGIRELHILGYRAASSGRSCSHGFRQQMASVRGDH